MGESGDYDIGSATGGSPRSDGDEQLPFFAWDAELSDLTDSDYSDSDDASAPQSSGDDDDDDGNFSEFESDEPLPYKIADEVFVNEHDRTANRAAAKFFKDQIRLRHKSAADSVFVNPDRMNSKDYIRETFKDFLMSREWKQLNMRSRIKKYHEEKPDGTHGYVWRLKEDSGAPEWMDRVSTRSGRTGALLSQTGRQKEALALRGALACYQCGVKQGELIGKYRGTTRFFTFDGLQLEDGTTPHSARKYKGKAPTGPALATLELAAGHACIRCVICAAMKSCKSAEPF